MKIKRMEDLCRWPVSGKLRVCLVWLVLVSAATACAGYKGIGVHETLSSGEKKKILEELKKNWQSYNVYCDGPVSAPAAVIFDPKDDDRNLIGYRYIKLVKEESVKTAIVWMEYQLDYNPFLYRIVDEEKNFYGYVLLAYELPILKRVDSRTLELPSFQSGFNVP